MVVSVPLLTFMFTRIIVKKYWDGYTSFERIEVALCYDIFINEQMELVFIYSYRWESSSISTLII